MRTTGTDRVARVTRLSWVCLMVALLAGCTPTLLYRHADRLIIWKVDQYFDLRSDQRSFLRTRLTSVLARHRTEALPRYERFLTEVHDKGRDGLDQGELSWAMTTYEELRADLLTRVLDDAAAFLASVNEQQIRYLERVLQREHERAERALKQDPEKRLAKRAAMTLDWLRDRVGTLTADQKQRITEWSRSLPDVAPLRLDYERYRKHELVELLRSTRDPARLSLHLSEWLLFPDRSGPVEYRRAVQQMQHAVADMVLAVDAILTPQQRLRALSEIQDLIKTVHALYVS